MKGARPLNRDEVSRTKDNIRGRWEKRNYALFVMGINTGFRIMELLSITVADLIDHDGKLKDYATVARRNMKGSKAGRTVVLNDSAKNALRPWMKELSRMGFTHKDDFVFQSQKGGNRPLCKQSAYRILEQAFRAAGLSGRLGTHAMRKTFANNIYDHFLRRAASGEPVDAFRCTSKALDHSNITSTDKYLSFRNEDVFYAIHSLEG